MIDSFYRRLVLVLLIPIFSYATKYVYNILLSHLLKGGLYGDFIVGYRTLVLFSSFILLGTATTTKRFLSTYLQKNDGVTEIDYIHWNLRLITKSIIFFMGFLMALLVLMVLLHVFNYKDFTSYHLAVYMVLLSPMAAFSTLLTIYIQCNDNVYLYNLLSQNSISLIYILAFLIVYYMFYPHFNNATLWLISFVVYFIFSVIVFILAFFYLPNIIFKNLLNPKNISRYSINISSEWKKTSRNFIISENLFLIICMVDLYIVKLCAQDAFAVSQYAAILSISAFVWVVSNCIAARLEPVIYSCLKQNDKTNLQKYTNQCSWMNFLVSSCATVLMIYFSKDILRMFGPDYSVPTVNTTLIILLIGYYIGTFSQLSNRLLALSGNERWLIYVAILELVLVITLGIILTIEYNIIGLAMATIISITIKMLIYVVLAHLKTRVKTLGFI